jgi:hypothetical protein
MRANDKGSAFRRLSDRRQRRAGRVPSMTFPKNQQAHHFVWLPTTLLYSAASAGEQIISWQAGTLSHS